MPPAAHGENEPFVPPAPPPARSTRAPAERGSPGAACQLPSCPTLPWARPRSLAGGQHPHYRCQARELEQRAGGAGPGHSGAGAPRVLGWGTWERAVPELSGVVGFSRVSDGRSGPHQPTWCLLDHLLLVLQLWHMGTPCWPASALLHPHLVKLLFMVHEAPSQPLSQGTVAQYPALAVLGGPGL